MGALLRSQALGQQRGGGPGGAGSGQASGSGSGSGQPQMPGPASGPLGLAARRAAAGRPTLGSMGSAPAPSGPPGGGLAARRGPPGGLNLSSMQGQATQKNEGNRFTDYSQIM